MTKLLGKIVFIVFLFVNLTPVTLHGQQQEELSGTITISGAWALYPMAVKWAEEFQKLYPKVKIDVSAGGAGKGMADALSGNADIGMISRDINPEEIKKGAWYVSVTKDAVVAVVNENNPVLKELLSKGVKNETVAGIWITAKIKSWGELSGTKNKDSIQVYTRSDACGAAEIWAKYMGKRQEDLQGVGVYGDPGLAEAVRKDALGMGYNNINYAYDLKTMKQISGLRVLPLDLNGNGKIDKDEDFYGTRDEITQAIAKGRYPSPPSRALHFACFGQPKKKETIEFIKWVLTDGQKFVPQTGYINLSQEKLNEEMKKLIEK